MKKLKVKRLQTDLNQTQDILTIKIKCPKIGLEFVTNCKLVVKGCGDGA